MSPQHAEAADRGERRVAKRDDGALCGAIQGDERRVAAGATVMRDDAAPVRGRQEPRHAHRVAVDSGDMLLRSRQTRRGCALAPAKHACKLAHRVGQRRAQPTPAMSTGRSHGTAGMA